jgi:lysophospholipase L1-like esterase
MPSRRISRISRPTVLVRAALGLLAIVAIESTSARADAVTRVSLIGDSITAGAGATSGLTTYPGVLGSLLGPEYSVSGFGRSAATMMNGPAGDLAYSGTSEFTASIANAGVGTSVVVIQLGTNDSRMPNIANIGHFLADCETMVDRYQSLPNHPQVWLNLPPPVGPSVAPGIFSVSVTSIPDQVIPLLRRCAADKGIPTIDVYSAFLPHLDYLGPDAVHPNDMGHALIARVVHAALVGSDAGVSPFPDAGADASNPVDARSDGLEAGPRPGPDAGVASGDASGENGGSVRSGCTCRAAPIHRPRLYWLWLALAALVVRTRAASRTNVRER